MGRARSVPAAAYNFPEGLKGRHLGGVATVVVRLSFPNCSATSSLTVDMLTLERAIYRTLGGITRETRKQNNKDEIDGQCLKLTTATYSIFKDSLGYVAPLDWFRRYGSACGRCCGPLGRM